MTGLRREDLAWLTWTGVRELTLVQEAAKKSAGKRRFATIPRIPALDSVLADLRPPPRASDVNTVLVTNAGQPWNLDTQSKEVTRIAKAAGIAHVDATKPGQPPRIRSKHLHDAADDHDRFRRQGDRRHHGMVARGGPANPDDLR